MRVRVLLFLVCLAALVTPVAADQRLTAEPNAYTNAQLLPSLEEFRKDRWNAYDACSPDPPELRDAAHKLFASVIAEGGSFQIDPAGKLVKAQGQELIKQGSKDPLVLAATAQAAIQEKPEEEIRQMVQAAREQLEKSKYGPWQRAEVVVRSYQILKEFAQRHQGQALPDKQEAVQALAAWLADPGAENRPRLVWATVRAFLDKNEDFAQPVLKAVAAYKQIDPWMLDLLEGHILMHEGFQAEGDEAKVKKLMWEAGDCLKSAYERRPEWPEPAVDMILIARDGHDQGSARLWFERAVAAQFDWSEAYTNFRSALHPRHGGSVEEVIEFGLECAATRRYDTIVPYQIGEAVFNIESRIFVSQQPEIWQDDRLYDALDRFCRESVKAKEYEGQPVPEERRKWIRAMHVAFAARAGEYADALPLISMTDDKLLVRAFEMFLVTETPAEILAKAEAAARAPGASFRQLKKLLASVKDRASAAEALAQVDKRLAATTDETGQRILKTYRAALQIYQQVQNPKAEWVNIKFPPELLQLGEPGWSLAEDQTLTSETKHYLPWDALSVVQPPYEVEFDIELKKLGPHSEGVGIFIGGEENLHHRPGGRMFGVSHKSGTAFIRGRGRTLAGKYLPAQEASLHVNCKLWPNYAEVFVNQVRVCAMHLERFDSLGRFNFGVWRARDKFEEGSPLEDVLQAAGKPIPEDKHADDGWLVHYRSVRLRRLVGEAPPWNDPAAARAYFKQLLKAEPKNPAHWLDLATTEQTAGQAQAGLKAVDQALKLLPNWPEARRRRAELLIDAGEYQTAADLLAELLREDKRDWQAQECSAWLHATCPDEKFRDATAAGKEAATSFYYSDSSRKWSTCVTWAAVFAEQGEFQNAEDSLSTGESWLRDSTDLLHLPRLTAVTKAVEAKQPYRLSAVDISKP